MLISDESYILGTRKWKMNMGIFWSKSALFLKKLNTCQHIEKDDLIFDFSLLMVHTVVPWLTMRHKVIIQLSTAVWIRKSPGVNEKARKAVSPAPCDPPATAFLYKQQDFPHRKQTKYNYSNYNIWFKIQSKISPKQMSQPPIPIPRALRPKNQFV